MRTRFLLVLAVAVAAPLLVYAYSCPILIKEAEESIAKAEPAVAKSSSTDKPGAERALAEAKKMVAEAKKEHEGAKAKAGHAAAIRKAKIARAYAEEAQILAER